MNTESTDNGARTPQVTTSSAAHLGMFRSMLAALDPAEQAAIVSALVADQRTRITDDEISSALDDAYRKTCRDPTNSLLERHLRTLYVEGSPSKTRADHFDKAITAAVTMINEFHHAGSRALQWQIFAILDRLAWKHDVSLPAFATFRRLIDLWWHQHTRKLPPDGCTSKQFRDRKYDANEKTKQIFSRVGTSKGLPLVRGWMVIVRNAIDHAIAAGTCEASKDSADSSGAKSL